MNRSNRVVFKTHVMTTLPFGYVSKLRGPQRNMCPFGFPLNQADQGKHKGTLKETHTQLPPPGRKVLQLMSMLCIWLRFAQQCERARRVLVCLVKPRLVVRRAGKQGHLPTKRRRYGGRRSMLQTLKQSGRSAKTRIPGLPLSLTPQVERFRAPARERSLALLWEGVIALHAKIDLFSNYNPHFICLLRSFHRVLRGAQ